MYLIMLIATLLIFAFTIYSGYTAGIFESSYMFFRNFVAFLLAFSLFPLGTNLIKKLIPQFSDYPVPQYIMVILFVAIFIILIGIADQMRYKHLFSKIDITINKYGDKIIGAIIGGLNGVIVSGFVLIFYALLPFVQFIPADFGRVNTARLPVDSGAVMLRTYSHISSRMGGKPFHWQAPNELSDEISANDPKGIGWEDIYRNHADFNSADLKKAAGRHVENGE